MPPCRLNTSSGARTVLAMVVAWYANISDKAESDGPDCCELRLLGGTTQSMGGASSVPNRLAPCRSSDSTHVWLIPAARGSSTDAHNHVLATPSLGNCLDEGAGGAE